MSNNRYVGEQAKDSMKEYGAPDIVIQKAQELQSICSEHGVKVLIGFGLKKENENEAVGLLGNDISDAPNEIIAAAAILSNMIDIRNPIMALAFNICSTKRNENDSND